MDELISIIVPVYNAERHLAETIACVRAQTCREWELLLVEDGALHAVRLKRKSVKRAKKKIAAAVYEYQADCDGEWGEIQFDFESGTAEIVRLAEWDTMVSKMFARKAISYVLDSGVDKLINAGLFCFYP